MNRNDLATRLEAASSELITKQRHGRQQRLLLGDEIRLAALGDRVPELCRRIAAEVEQGTYVVGRVQRRSANIEGKQRSLYQSNLEDHLLASALARVVSERCSALVDDRVYSYRRGVSSWDAVFDFGRYVRRHREEVSVPTERGLYVVRRDVQAYGDSIPLDEESTLWESVDRCLGSDTWLLPVVRGLLRPALRQEPEAHVSSVPTGSPLQPSMCNLYLAPVDVAAPRDGREFYARYGDDIVFAHPVSDVARDAALRIDSVIGRLRLRPSRSKCGDYFFNGAGGRSRAWPEAIGASQLDYLGASLTFRGTLALKREKSRTLTRSIFRRIQHGLRVDGGHDERSRAELAVRIANTALDPRHRLCERWAPMVASLVTDRSSLRDLDYRVALGIAEQVTRRRGVRAFRQLPYRVLRHEHGLVSLLHRRDRAHREDP